jgi:hypothetical protein
MMRTFGSGSASFHSLESSIVAPGDPPGSADAEAGRAVSRPTIIKLDAGTSMVVDVPCGSWAVESGRSDPVSQSQCSRTPSALKVSRAAAALIRDRLAISANW